MTIATPSRLIRTAATSLLAAMLVFACFSADAQNRPERDPLLSQEQIELIKVYEVKLNTDPPPRIRIPRDKLREFLRENQSDDRIPRGKQNQDRWLRADGHKQLELLFEFKAREYYRHVRVASRIESLREFGNMHRRYILGFFQPTFGTGAVPELYLFPQGRDSDRIEMTNYYILTQTEIGGKPIIDRNNPEDSLLVQWGLPRESAKFPAPDVKGWEKQFNDTEDERFVEMVEWIESLVAANQGSPMGINYQPPRHQKPRN
jgi:hypothetical protein